MLKGTKKKKLQQSKSCPSLAYSKGKNKLFRKKVIRKVGQQGVHNEEQDINIKSDPILLNF